MPEIPIVENPRRRKRALSVKQLAAGFGGRGRMGGRRKRRRSRPRRSKRNPGAAVTFAGNPKRRYYPIRSYRPSRGRSNPRLGPFQFDFGAAAYVGIGIAGSRVLPVLIGNNLWPGMPRTGFMFHGIRIGAVLVLGLIVRQITRSAASAGQVVAGGLGVILYDLVMEYAGPKIGLTGALGGYVTDAGQVPGGNGSRRLAVLRTENMPVHEMV